MRSRRLLPVLLLGLALSGCGQHEIDGREVERDIMDAFPHKNVVADCPDHVKSVPGRHFTCTISFNESRSQVNVAIEDEDGGYSFRLNVLTGGGG